MSALARRLHDDHGVTLIETLVAVAILGLTLVVFLAGLQTGLISTRQSDALSTAHAVARSQMEYTKNASYQAAPTAYATVTPPSGYTVSSNASTIGGGDANIQLITVQVLKAATPVFTLEGYKVNR
jgi:prepilin-type N-terminal cleavage/methylation domain-containing protein